jgi:hypothetical protein
MDGFNKVYKIIYKNYDKEHYEKYEINDETLAFIMYDVTTKKKSALERKGQKKFKNQLIERYNNKCVISCNPMIVTEAAHIIPFSMCNSETCYDVNNGLLLSANLHKLFDSYKMSINKSGHVVFSHDVLAEKLYIDAHDFNNKHIKLNDKTMKNLNIHYNLFLKNNNV